MAQFLTMHGARVQTFMQRAKQYMPEVPTIPAESVRLLRARLIMEEALETINALGFSVVRPAAVETVSGQDQINDYPIDDIKQDLRFVANLEPDLVGIADGCADVSVVTIGTMLACGIQDAPILEVVDQSNLSKFGPGHSIRDDGKLVKPPDFKGPGQDIEKALRAQGWNPPAGR